MTKSVKVVILIRTQEMRLKKVDCMIFSIVKNMRSPRRTLEQVIKKDLSMMFWFLRVLKDIM